MSPVYEPLTSDPGPEASRFAVGCALLFGGGSLGAIIAGIIGAASEDWNLFGDALTAALVLFGFLVGVAVVAVLGGAWMIWRRFRLRD